MLMDPPHCLHGGLLDAHMNNSNKETQSLQNTPWTSVKPANGMQNIYSEYRISFFFLSFSKEQ